MKKVLIVILNYHQHHFINDLIESLKRQIVSFEYKIVIGDIDPTQEEVREINKLILNHKKEPIIYEKIEQNIGYAKGNNYLIKKYSELYPPDYVVISNSDIELIDKNCLLVMFNELESNQNVSVVGPKILSKEGKLQGPYNRMTINRILIKNLIPPFYYLIRKKEKNTFKNLSQKTYVWRIMGCFFMIDFFDFKQVDFFDEKTFLYWEEDILSYKLEKINRKVMYMPEVKVLHKHESESISRKFNEYDFESMLRYFEIVGEEKFKISLIKFSSLIFKNFWQYFLK